MGSNMTNALISLVGLMEGHEEFALNAWVTMITLTSILFLHITSRRKGNKC